MSHILLLIAIALYSIATALIARQLRSPSNDVDGLPRSFYIACLAAAMHGIYTVITCFAGARLNLSLSSMAVVVSLITTVIFLLAGTRMSIRRLGILVFPMTILSLVFSLAWPESDEINPSTNTLLSVHILISLSAYAFITLALIQALLHWYQERQIRARTQPAMLTALPPLQTMELLWFRLVLLGFSCLTLTLVSGALFSQQIFGHAFVFQHHTVLAVMGWFVFLVLIFNRLRTGLRGIQAALWTFLGFGLIQLGYFGTKIVSESLHFQ